MRVADKGMWVRGQGREGLTLQIPLPLERVKAGKRATPSDSHQMEARTYTVSSHYQCLISIGYKRFARPRQQKYCPCFKQPTMSSINFQNPLASSTVHGSVSLASMSPKMVTIIPTKRQRRPRPSRSCRRCLQCHDVHLSRTFLNLLPLLIRSLVLLTVFSKLLTVATMIISSVCLLICSLILLTVFSKLLTVVMMMISSVCLDLKIHIEDDDDDSDNDDDPEDDEAELSMFCSLPLSSAF